MVKRATSTPDEFFTKDIDRISTVTPKQQRHDSSSSKFFCNTADDLKPLPLLRDAPVPDREKLLLEKLRLCCRLFDFTVATSCIKSKEVKRQTLAEIADYIITNTHCLTTDRVYEELLRMVRVNAFRPLPPSSMRDDALGIPDSEDEVNLEPAWPHLQAVYEVFLRFLATPEYQAAICKRYMDHTFIVGLLQLFDSEDPRERDYLKTILHRIYGKLVNLRPFIRKQINHIFLRFIYETESHNGIAELLEILASIINGFQVPLKEEHKVFLRYILLPLHKAHTLIMFQSQLAYCVTEFLKKDNCLMQTCLQDGLFKFWPKVDTQKEMLFINELEEFLECADPSDLQAVIKPLFQRIARCVASTHFQVAERTLYLWSNDHFILILANFAEIGMPILLPALYELHTHWNKNLRPLMSNVLRMMEDMNQSLFNHCSLKAKEAKKQ
ncbi:hypothetical protein Ciccas_010558 [Cichlidogyrus casuarinus]|uniref:Serine/threonine protein phosphatase 2A regulatory subunit n=1 Tax=Cichlidogyrus casuarinus TaxID=1844966 RepID=A0ABD2PUD0_9PLAT